MLLLRCKEPAVIQRLDLQLNMESEPRQEMKFYYQKLTSLTHQQPMGFELVLTTLTEQPAEVKPIRPLSVFHVLVFYLSAFCSLS